ncbi:MAG: hypothetical protein QOE25_1150, partial [Actinomycetota bacterium]|nr:hypothetical protein [Actinomycetota bacterium]
MIRRVTRMAAIGVLVFATALGPAASGGGRAPGTRLRPDLVDLRPKGLTLDIRHSGTRRLRFSTFTVNIGAGPMELRSRQLD